MFLTNAQLLRLHEVLTFASRIGKESMKRYVITSAHYGFASGSFRANDCSRTFWGTTREAMIETFKATTLLHSAGATIADDTGVFYTYVR